MPARRPACPVFLAGSAVFFGGSRYSDAGGDYWIDGTIPLIQYFVFGEAFHYS